MVHGFSGIGDGRGRSMVERVEMHLEKQQDLQKQQSGSPADELPVPAEARAWANADPFGKMPLLKRLMENPDLQETLLAWLLQNRRGQGGGSGPALSPEPTSGVDYGFGHLQRREEWATSSTFEEVTRYCQQLRHRADWLEATLTETLKELERIEQIRQAMIANTTGDISSVD